MRLADKERVFQLLLQRCNLVGDMSLAQFEAWFGPLEDVVWDAPASAVDWGEDFWMGFRTFMPHKSCLLGIAFPSCAALVAAACCCCLLGIAFPSCAVECQEPRPSRSACDECLVPGLL